MVTSRWLLTHHLRSRLWIIQGQSLLSESWFSYMPHRERPGGQEVKCLKLWDPYHWEQGLDCWFPCVFLLAPLIWSSPFLSVPYPGPPMSPPLSQMCYSCSTYSWTSHPSIFCQWVKGLHCKASKVRETCYTVLWELFFRGEEVG